ncbi:C45 family peptidase [Mesorhizobium sp. 1M-11]|uniref:C45 family autoproteolytic acyltransferase/hydolase n=1 Tax=Mesorhizobium sp. 1M-11 TaxID=1529006 RepID=UPI0006C7695B|nr:C45 family peptidase [Mesorhizobium sp. 1M-11]
MRTENLPVVDCAGDARRRGQAHGEALRGVISAKVERWREAIGEAYGTPASLFLPRFLDATDFRVAIAEHTPDLADEVVGIAEGAGLSEETAYALQLMDEEWWWGRSNAAHCSSLAVVPADGRPVLIAQTMDLPRWHDGAQALLKIHDEDHECLVFTSAGMIGLMGVSGRGLGVCVNTLSQLAVNPRGLPVAFVMRGVLARASAAAAAEFLGRVPHASGQNYQLGDRSEARTFECSAGGVVQVPFSNGCSPHTNHPLVSTDRRDAAARMEGSEDSRGRLESLRTDIDVVPDAAAVKAVLAARRTGGIVSITPQSAALTASMTIGSVIYSLGETIELSVCAGPPSHESWRAIAM